MNYVWSDECIYFIIYLCVFRFIFELLPETGLRFVKINSRVFAGCLRIGLEHQVN